MNTGWISTQYGAEEFAVWCTTNNGAPCMGRTGVCWDNAAAESFFATLKTEMYHRYRFDTRARARFAVSDHIELFSDRRRKHLTLGSRTPGPALNDHQQQAAIAA